MNFGWLRDNRTLWYVSEESGYAHLYTKAPTAEAHALTQGPIRGFRTRIVR